MPQRSGTHECRRCRSEEIGVQGKAEKRDFASVQKRKKKKGIE
jgi:hypothetical protein